MGAFHIRNIDGLGPVKATVNSKGYGSLDGEYYTGSHIGKRNIVITLGMNPAAGFRSVEAMRKVIYAYLLTRNEPILRFISDDRPDVQIEGHVESCEPTLFSKDPEMQISIICPKPFFVSSTLKSVSGVASAAPLFTPFIHDCDMTNGIGFQMFKGAQDYDGSITIESGDHRPTTRQFMIYRDQKPVGINSAQYFALNSHQGSKTVELRNTSTNVRVANLLGNVTDPSLWPYVVPGINRVRVLINSNVGMPWILYYVERFGGL